MKPIVILYITILLAGCTDNKYNPREEHPAYFDDHYSELNILSLDFCKGIYAQEDWLGPPGQNGPGPTPTNWTTNLGGTSYNIDYHILNCRGYGWAELDLKDINILIESHDRYFPPESCRIGPAEDSFYRFISNIIVDDANILDQLLEKGLPATMGEISFFYGTDKSIFTTVTPMKSPSTILRTVDNNLTWDQGLDSTYSYFWIDSRDSLNRLATNGRSRMPIEESTVAKFEPPFILADKKYSRFVSSQTIMNYSLEAFHTIFDNLDCREDIYDIL